MKRNNDLEMEDCGQPAKLLEAWHSKNLKEFERTLNEDCDPNYIYTEEKYRPILGIIARDGDPSNKETKKFAEAVLKSNVQKETRYANGMRAIHAVCETGNLPVLEALVEAVVDLNATDGRGNTPLHLLIQNWKTDFHKKCFEYLLDQEGSNFNAINRAGFVPIHLAARQKNKIAVKLLLEKGSKLQLDDNFVGNEKITPRQAVVNAFPDLASELPPDLGPDWSNIKMDCSKLFNLLLQGEIERFCTAFKKEMLDKSQKGLLTAMVGPHTLLQIACDRGYTQAVDALLSSGADVNYFAEGEEPIRTATRNGNAEILQLLLNYHPRLSQDVLNKTIMHTLVIDYKDNENYAKCFEIILELCDKRQLDINAQDLWGNTALHYAAINCPEKLVVPLLNHGSYLGICNKKNETPLKWLPSIIFEEFLNSLVSESDKKRANDEYMIKFNYAFLEPKEPGLVEIDDEKIRLTSENTSTNVKPKREILPLLAMSKIPELRKLLIHPVLTSFTLLKWQRIRLLYQLNLFFYVIFCLLLSSFILINTQPDRTNHTEPVCPIKDFEVSEVEDSSAALLGLRLLIGIFIFLLFLRELFQVVTTYKVYFFILENWLEVLIIVLSAVVVIKDCPRVISGPWNSICTQTSSVVILLASIELLLLIGKHPNYAIQMEMLGTVTKSFGKFLGWYVLLILGFALSFFVLFRGCTGGCCEDDPFPDAYSSMFKTVVMLTGEFESGDIPFNAFRGTSHLIFAAFVFLIAIVLINLLNGLAVADTKSIRDDAYLCTCVSRVKLLSFVEDILFRDNSNFFNFLRNFKCCCPINYFSDKVALFSSYILKQSFIVSFKPNLGGRLYFDGPITASGLKQTCSATLSNYYVDSDTIASCREIIDIQNLPKQQEDTSIAKIEKCCRTVEEFANKLLEIEKKFDAIEHSNKQIEKLLIQNIAIVSLNHANDE